ncbi:hypothetical protein GTQ40_11460 [Flavobacteriaceae bacterium R38]|nr:hypothetical protein [Flavobacteriaceae bacterium R38]
MNYRLLLVFLMCFCFGKAQDVQFKKNKDELTISDYRIISYKNDTTYFDTTLTVQKEYKYNYLRKDDFELLPFSNIGQSYNKLAYNFKKNSLYPELGARAKHFNYWEVEDVFYYSVPTPTTELFFKTVSEQGQVADGFFTVNTSERFNFSIANKGLRSLGKFQNIRSSIGNFRFTANYRTKNGRYGFKAHFTGQDIENQENGGITNREQFESENPEFDDRSRIDVAFQDAENLLVGKRYYLDHYYKIYDKKDSVSNSQLSLQHLFNYETKFYRFDQNSANVFFGDSFQSDNLTDRAQLRSLFNQVNLNYSNNVLGNIQGKAIAYNYNYFFRSALITDDGLIPSNLRGDEFAVGGQWTKTFNKLKLAGDFTTNLSGDLGGISINATAILNLGKGDYFKAHAFSTSRMPNFNFLLNQSNYIQYNWLNTDTFVEEERLGVGFDLKLNKWLHLEADYTTIDNYTYFGQNPLTPTDDNPQVAPFQSGETINYLKIKLNKEFKLGKFALNNTLMYQNVEQNQDILNVPEFVTRNTLYFSDHLFKKALYLQTGITFKYFTNYFADGYNPLISEFFSQNQEEIGEFPLIDLFINVKVRRTRIYLKAEHLNSPFTGNDFYSAPDYPYRDFIVRFGLVWNFFI